MAGEQRVLVGGEGSYYHLYDGCARLGGDGAAVGVMSLSAAKHMGFARCPGCARHQQGVQPHAVVAQAELESMDALRRSVRDRIETNRLNRGSSLWGVELQCMPWLDEERTPSWSEFVDGLFAAMAIRGRLFRRQAQFINGIARIHSVSIRKGRGGHHYTAPDGREIWVGKANGDWLASPHR